MEINKSSRHQKIIGDFGENLICNWLSRSGFEVSIVDHTGIDIIAFNPSTGERLGITVKSRTRNKGKEEEKVNLFFYKRAEKDDRRKLLDACKYFACDPWIGVYVETPEFADVYLTSLDNYDDHYRGREGKAIEDWKMAKKYRDQYADDPYVKHIRIQFQAGNWWE